MDSGALIVNDIAIIRSHHGVKGVGVPFQWVCANTAIALRRLVRNDGDIAASFVMNSRSLATSPCDGCTILTAVATGRVDKNISAVADFRAVICANDGIHAMACNIAFIFN